MTDRWLSVAEVAPMFGGGVMRVYRRIWAGDLEASNEAIEGQKNPRYKIRESSVQRYFESRAIAVPKRGLS